MFTPSAAVYAAGVPVLTANTQINAAIVSGALRGPLEGPLTLLATDNTGLTYEGLTGFFYWTVTITIDGAAQPSWSFFLPHSPSTVDLYELANTAASGGFSNPMTTLGDILYENASPAATRLPGNTTSVREFLVSQGASGAAQAPFWGTLQPADLAEPYQFLVPRLGGGSDDGVNISAAIANAITYALNHQAYAEVVLPDVSGAYLANTAPTIGGVTFKGNAIIPIYPQSATAVKPVIKLRGASAGAAHSLSHWQQQVPQAAGTVIATTRTDGTNDVSNGPAFVIGGPYNGYGGGSALFSNLLIVVDGITIQVPWNGTYGGFGFFGIAEAEIISASCMADAVPVSGTSYPNMGGTNYGSITNPWPVGLMMPDVNDNDLSNIYAFSSEGLYVATLLSEHTVFQSIRAIYCNVAAQIGSASGSPAAHGLQGGYLSAENCDSGVVGLGAASRVNITQLDIENCSNAIYDPHNYLNGYVGLRENSSIPPAYGTFSINGAAALRIIALDAAPGPVGSPQAPPASNAAWANLYYRDAWITLHATTITALSIDSTAQNGLAGSPATYSFLLPSGHSYTPTYTGTLTHTVTLL